MNFMKLAAASRHIHRICVSFMAIFGVVMLVTGTMMKFGFDATGSARLFHNFLSPLFAVFFIVMLATGLVMYLQPWILKRARTQQTPQPPTAT